MDFQSPSNFDPTKMTRRHFLWLSSMAAAGVAAGCATNPVTGKQQLMLVSEDQEIQIDRQHSPYQLSADYGIVQDQALNSYIERIGKNMSARTHRPHMPYNFHAVNATYVNAYAFPGGTIACTRGILLTLENEGELAALLGHELGHVNARHTAEQMSKGMLSQAALGGLSTAITGSSSLGDIASGALLASYSRQNEREADALGLEYLVDSGYSPQGMVGLMNMLNSLGRQKPNAIELMFSTHPMSEERYKTVLQSATTKYKSAEKQPLHRQRYMDHTARLRAQKGAIEAIQNGDKALGQKKFPEAEGHYRSAIKLAPGDYTALVMMSKTQLIQKNWAVGRQYAEMAQKVYPREAQAYHLSGFAKIQLKDYEGALEEFNGYDRILAGNPNTTFFKGFAYEGMKKYRESAGEYQRYLQVVNQGDYARHAYKRLRQWKAKGLI